MVRGTATSIMDDFLQARPRLEKTPFLMAYGLEAKNLVEFELPSPGRLQFNEIPNDK